MAFDEVRFPPGISYGASGGPERKTEIITLASGYEERNSVWANSRHRFNIGYGIRNLDDVFEVKAFFEARSGKLRAFRFKDWSDFNSSKPLQPVSSLDQVIGSGNGTQSTFQLFKAYTDSSQSYLREIRKPVSGTVRISVAGVEKTIGTEFTVDYTTGIVTFTAGNIPLAASMITAGFEFDVPARFDADWLSINLTEFAHGSIPSIEIIEVRL